MSRKKSLGSFIFLIPSLIGFSIFYLIPFGMAFGRTLVGSGARGRFVGFGNYMSLVQNEIYTNGLKNSLIFIGCSVPISMGVALLIALGIKRLEKKKRMLQCMVLIPLVIPTASIAFFWKQFFALNGTFSKLNMLLGGKPIEWLQSAYAMPIMIFIYVWKNIGYNTILYTAGLYNIPAYYYESAGLEGANSRQIFYYITWPLLTETTILVLIMSVVNSFKVFKEIYLIAGAYPDEHIYMLQHYMNNMFLGLDYEKLSTSAYILVLLMVILMAGASAVNRRKQNEV